MELRAGDAAALNDRARSLRRSILSLALLLVLIAALLIAVPGLHDVARKMQHAHTGWLVAAVVLEVLSGIGYVPSGRCPRSDDSGH